ncbi:MAG: hypothetical protein IPN90_01750 [Elusimicrobia bacterium]|nr:hypothetical protein [Elusimicrobiota bacterium]
MPRTISSSTSEENWCARQAGELYIGYRKHVTPNGFYGVAYKAKITACRGCELRAKCLQNPNTKYRQVYKFKDATAPSGSERNNGNDSKDR